MRTGAWFFLGALLCVSPTSAQEIARPPDIIQNGTYRFKIDNPEGWNAKKTESDNAVLLISPKQDMSDTFLENVTVYVEGLVRPAGETLETCRAKYAKSLEKTIQDLEFRSQESIQIDNQPAVEMIYVGSVKGRTIKWKTILTFKNERVYVLSYTADDKDYFKNLEAANKILYSFRFI